MLKSLKRRVTGLILPGKGRRAFGKVPVLLVLLGGWTFLCKGAWQLWLADWPWLRLIVAIVMFALPGVCLQHILYDRPRASASRYLTLGFAISVALTGLLGLVASVAHFSFRFVTDGLFAAGGIGLLALVVKGVSLPKKRIGVRTQAWALASVLPALVAIMLAGRLCSRTYPGGDDFTYVAYTTHFEHSEGLSFNEILFGLEHLAPSRLWLMFWPLAEAVIAHESQLHGLELAGVYLGPVLAALSLLAVFEAARSLGFSRQGACLALVAQFSSLLLLTYQNQAGQVFFNRLTEDKVVAAFVMAPVLFRLAVDFLNDPNKHRLVLLVVVGLGLGFTHPVMTGLAFMIVTLYGLFDLGLFRNVRGVALLLCVSGAIVMAFLSVRFAPSGLVPAFPLSLEDAAMGIRAARRLEILQDGRFYGINRELVQGIPFAVVAAAGVLAPFRWRRAAPARYVVSSLALVCAAVVPWTGWLIGLAIHYSQLWRVPWLTPFGVSAAFLVDSLVNFMPRIMPQIRGHEMRATRIMSFSAQLLLLLLVGVAYALSISPIGDLQSLSLEFGWRPEHQDLICMGNQLDVLIGDGALVVGDPETNHFIPGLSAKAKVLVFRQERSTMVQGGFRAEEAHNRWVAWQRIVGPDTSRTERMRTIMEYEVEFILLRGDPPWMESLVHGFHERLKLVARSEEYRLYEVVRPAYDYYVPSVQYPW